MSDQEEGIAEIPQVELMESKSEENLEQEMGVTMPQVLPTRNFHYRDLSQEQELSHPEIIANHKQMSKSSMTPLLQNNSAKRLSSAVVSREDIIRQLNSKSSLSINSKRDGNQYMSGTSSQKNIIQEADSKKEASKQTSKNLQLHPGMSKGPNALYPSIDLLCHEVKPDEWRNIPVPMCEAFKQMINCLVDIKKSIHSGYNDNLETQRAVNFNTLDLRRANQLIKNEIYDEITIRDEARNALIVDAAQVCRENEIVIKNELEETIKQYIDEKNVEAQTELKNWVKNLVSHQVQESQHIQRAFMMQQINMVKDMFDVPDIVGSECAFTNHQSFMEHLYKSEKDKEAAQISHAQSISKIQVKINALEKEMKLKMSEVDYEKDERKLVQKFDAKFLEVRENLRRQENDYNTKLATLKVDFSMVTFEKKTFNFLKDKVCSEWNTQVVGQGKEHGMRLDVLDKTQKRVIQKLNGCLGNLELGQFSDDTDCEGDESSVADSTKNKEETVDEQSNQVLSEVGIKEKSVKSKRSKGSKSKKSIKLSMMQKSVSGQPLSGSMVSPASTSQPTGRQTGRNPINSQVMARLDLMDQRFKTINDLEEHVDELQRQLNQLRISIKNNESPTRSQDSDARKMTRQEKRDIIKRRGSILDLREIKSGTASKRPTSPAQQEGMEEQLMLSKNPHPALAWDPNRKKWMGHDQMVVETAFRMPKLPGQINSGYDSPLSENLDGQMLHLENAQYVEYATEFTRLQVEQEIEQRRVQFQSQNYLTNGTGLAIDATLGINAAPVQQKPRLEMNVLHPSFLHNQQTQEIPATKEHQYRSDKKVGEPYKQFDQVKEILDETQINEDLNDESYYNQRIFQQQQPAQDSRKALFDRRKPQSATNYHSKSGNLRHQSLTVNQGVLKSLGIRDDSGSLGHAERDTQGESSQNMIRSEMCQIKEFAKTRASHQKDRKLFRPQTGTAQGRTQAMGVIQSRGLQSIGNLPPKASISGNKLRGSSHQSGLLPLAPHTMSNYMQINNRTQHNQTGGFSINDAPRHLAMARPSESSDPFYTQQYDKKHATLQDHIKQIQPSTIGDQTVKPQQPLQVKFESLGSQATQSNNPIQHHQI